VPDHVPEPLGVDDQLHARMQADARLGSRVGLVLAQDEHGLARRVIQLQPGPDHPAGPVRVQPVVVIEVQLAQRGRFIAGIQLDDPHPPVVTADPLDIAREFRCDLAVGGPDPELVRLAVVPEAAAVHLPGRRRQRGEVRVAAALPVHVLHGLPFGRRDRRTLEVLQDDEALFSHDVELVMHAVPPSHVHFRARTRPDWLSYFRG